MANRKLTGSHLISHALKAEGVKNIFTIAGDHTLPVMDAMADDGFNFVDTRHEQAASFMADGYGRITGKLGVVMTTTPGMANAIPGLANGLHSESPMLSLAGSAEFSELGKGANQEIDQIALASAVTKGAWMVTDARRIPDMIAMAIRTAYSGRRGPVHLTVPLDVQEQKVFEEDFKVCTDTHNKHVGSVVAGAEEIRQAVDVLNNARRPLIIAGPSAGYSPDGSTLKYLVETTKIPVMTSDQSRGLIPDDHPYCLGYFDSALNWATKLVGDADVVLILGRKFDNSIGYGNIFNEDCKIIQVDPDQREIGRNRSIDVGLVGDVSAIIGQLADESTRHIWVEKKDWIADMTSLKQSQSEWYANLARPETPMHATYVHSVLNRFLTPEDILVWDGGDFGHFGRMLHKANEPLSWFYFAQFGTLGNGLPTALAAKIAHPNRRVILISGDGGFGFTAMEFDTAVRHNLPIVCILGNDACWGIDYHIQVGIYGRPVATNLLPTRYDKVVEGLGGYGQFVQTHDEFEPALKRAFSSGRPALINAVIQNGISPRAEAAIVKWKNRRAKIR